MRFTNRGTKPASYTINHTYNRLPWGASEGVAAIGVTMPSWPGPREAESVQGPWEPTPT